MTQPDYVPLVPSDRVRRSDRLSVPGSWHQDRPAELRDLTPPTGARFGLAGTDAGYGLKLAKRFEDRLQLVEGEVLADAVAGSFACGAKRAASFGRAPVIHDMDWAYSLWGLLGGAAPDLVSWRRILFRGASHHYWDQREIVDHVKDSTLRLTPAQVRERIGSGWADLFVRD